MSSGDLDIVGVADVDAISVGACSRGGDIHSANPNILAVSDEKVNSFAIEGTNASNDPVSNAVEFDVLH